MTTVDDRCGHCKRLTPTWDELAKVYNDDSSERPVVIAKVDCTEHTALCADQGITGYPTLRFFQKTSTDFSRYKGPRDLDALKTFVEEQFLNEQDEESSPTPPEPETTLFELTDSSFLEHIKHGNHFIMFYAPWCGHCQKLAPAWQQLAEDFQKNKDITVAKLDCTAYGTICESFSVKGYPTLLWFKDGQQVDQYQSSRTIDDLTNYASKMLKQHNTELHRTDEMIVEAKDEVVTLTNENFDEMMAKGMYFVKFYAPWCGHCKRLAPVWAELSEKFSSFDDVHIAKVDCTVEGDICKTHEVRGYPTLMLFNNGVKISDYNLGRDLNTLQLFVEENVQKRDEL